MHPVVQPDFGLLWKWNKWSDSIFWLYVRSCRIHTHSCCTLQSIALLGLLWAQCRYVASVVNSGGGISSSSTWEKYDYGKITCKSILGKEICCLMATINCSRISLGIVYLYAVCSVYSVHGIVSQSTQEILIAAFSMCAFDYSQSHRNWMKARRYLLWISRTIRCVQQIQSKSYTYEHWL